jgi:hypothetical protein
MPEAQEAYAGEEKEESQELLCLVRETKNMRVS